MKTTIFSPGQVFAVGGAIVGRAPFAFSIPLNAFGLSALIRGAAALGRLGFARVHYARKPRCRVLSSRKPQGFPIHLCSQVPSMRRLLGRITRSRRNRFFAPAFLPPRPRSPQTG